MAHLKNIRILAVTPLWQGSDGYAYVKAFRRMGHSVAVVPADSYVPARWKWKPLRTLHRILEPLLIREYSRALVEKAKQLQPHLFFVFKGRNVTRETILNIQKLGTVAVNFYPDVSFMVHGKHIPRALPVYDWVFTTKTFGLEDMKKALGVTDSSFIPHGYDPEVHFPVGLSTEDLAKYQCDVSFIGTRSPEKQRLLEYVCDQLPDIKLRVWGEQWHPALTSLGSRIGGYHVLGLEYAKALVASKISLGLLSTKWKGASSGDRITSRTFHIPATGAFMLHECTNELAKYFSEGLECACFKTPEELTDKIKYYLENPDERIAIAAAGRRRSIDSGYSVDNRAKEILKKFCEICQDR